MNDNMAAGRDVKDSNIKVTLENKELWNKFGSIGTEMIITKCGRYVNTTILELVLFRLLQIILKKNIEKHKFISEIR